MSSKIVHWEIMGPEGGAMAAFYEDLFGWKTTSPEGFDEYHLVDADQTGVGGAVGKGPEGMTYITLYVEVDSIDKTLAAASKAGAEVVMPRTEIPEVATYALFRDPVGNMVGLVEVEVPTAS